LTITQRTSKIVWGRFAGRCCFCRSEVIHLVDGKVTSLVGEMAHIVGEKKSAARGISTLSLIERNDSENLMLMCREHHKIVDDNEKLYTVHKLNEMRDGHFKWLSETLVKISPWKSNLSQLVYINVPRLCEQSELQGFKVDLSKYKPNQTLHSLGWELNHVMSAFQTVLARLTVGAISIEQLRLLDTFVGTPISFDRKSFRTKNVPANDKIRLGDIPIFTGDFRKDAHIYTRLGEFKIILAIDARWITTSTAFMLFRPSSGQNIFSGIGRVTSVDYQSSIITVTPWVIGLPKGPLDELNEASRTVPSESIEKKSSLDSLVDMQIARSKELYFSSPPERCDLCTKSFAIEKYMIDGAMKNARGWAFMCEACFLERGRSIGWGHGQLYLREDKGWLEVAGFPPADCDDGES
jgi:hypothetical protein